MLTVLEDAQEADDLPMADNRIQTIGVGTVESVIPADGATTYPLYAKIT